MIFPFCLNRMSAPGKEKNEYPVSPNSPAIGASPYLEWRLFREHMIFLIGGSRHVGMVGQDAQAPPNREIAQINGRA